MKLGELYPPGARFDPRDRESDCQVVGRYPESATSRADRLARPFSIPRYPMDAPGRSGSEVLDVGTRSAEHTSPAEAAAR